MGCDQRSQEPESRSQEDVGESTTRLEGSRFGAYLKNLAIFFRERGRPNKVLNRRLPGITARDVLSIVLFGGYSSA